MGEFFGMNDPAPARPAGAHPRGAACTRADRLARERRIAFQDGWELEEPDARFALPAPPASPAPVRPRLIADVSAKAIVRDTSPDVPFDRAINPYRGCEHGCVYCFARPGHAALGLSPQTDFDTKILVKRAAPALLAAELRAPAYVCAPIAIGADTDPYQPAETQERVTRALLETLRAHRHPLSVTTKGALVTRDADILGEMGRAGLAQVTVSLTTLDSALSRAMEPRAASPQARLRAIRTLARAGVPVGVLIAPIVPGLTDHEIERMLEAAAAAGASSAAWIALRVPPQIEGSFVRWLHEAMPERAERVMNRVRELHGDEARGAAPGRGASGRGVSGRGVCGRGVSGRGVSGRGVSGQVASGRAAGEGGVWSGLIRRRFEASARRLGLDRKAAALRCDLFRVPAQAGDQFTLF
jgi:DNA repair photolyase